ncbi:MAG: nuclear transport factor 2 family protein [Pseudomonadota bacterium]
MDLKEIGEALVTHCRNDTALQALDTLYHRDAVSVEAMLMPGTESRETGGVEAIKGKHHWFDSTFEVHESTVDGPYLHGEDRFGVIFQLDATHRESGERTPMKEMAIYTVKLGKIVREEFYYT